MTEAQSLFTTPSRPPQPAGPWGGGVVAEAPRGEAQHTTRIALWLPLTPLWLVLAPFALLLAPALSLAPPLRGVSPYRAVLALGAVLLALSGTVVEVDAPGAVIRLRFF